MENTGTVEKAIEETIAPAEMDSPAAKAVEPAGARPLGSPPVHSEDGPTERGPYLPLEGDTLGLRNVGNPASHEPTFTTVPTSSGDHSYVAD